MSGGLPDISGVPHGLPFVVGGAWLTNACVGGEAW
jgi:hypothetical protein